MIQLSEEFLGGFFGKTPGEISKALKTDDEEPKPQEEVETYIQDLLSDKLKKVKGEGKEEAYGRAKREVLSEAESKLAEKYGVEDYENYEDLVDTIVSKQKQEVVKKTGKKELDPEEIKNSEVFINAVKAEIKKREDIEEEFDSFKSQVQTEQKKSKFRSDLDKFLEKHKFDLPENETIRENLIGALEKEVFESVDIEYDDDGIAVKDKNGNPVKDQNLNPLPYEDFVVGKAKNYFEIKKSDDRKTPGAQTKKPGEGGGDYTPPAEIKSFSDFKREMKKLDKIEDKKALTDHFKQLEEAGKLEK